MALILQQPAFDPWALAQDFAAGAAGAGAIVTFCGQVRGDGGLIRLEVEHYPAMTQPAIAAMMAEATQRFALLDALVVHRHGPMQVGEVIMMVATAAPHRADAFAGAEFLMDYLKSRAPFWKKEYRADGAQWVAAKDSDEAALSRW
jgi:molybdopterin synthase catalytic subunit